MPPNECYSESSEEDEKKFLGIYFRCCRVYGRIYKNEAKTAYSGRCPKCGRKVRAKIGENGTDQRFFQANPR